MKKINFLYVSIAMLFMNSAYADGNLFAPKKEGVSEKELNRIVEQRLNDQKNMLENNFNNEISTIKQSQEDRLNQIMVIIEELKTENTLLKESQETMKLDVEEAKNNISNVGSYSHNVNSSTAEPVNTYSEAEVNEELKQIMGNAENGEQVNAVIQNEDILRLNAEFGETGLTFVGILDNQKIYKNSDGEYIIKDINFINVVEENNEEDSAGQP